MFELGHFSVMDFSGILLAYLVGSISSAIIVCKLMGFDDPRKDGSGNPGATNVKRLYGTKPAAITLAGDMLKGWLPVFFASQMGAPSLLVFLIGFAAFLGHLYPVFFGFKGGKGVATAMGMMLGLSLPIGLAVVGTWLFVAKVLKISSASALVAMALAPLYIYLLSDNMDWVILTVPLTIILFWRHKNNIQRLISGTED